MSHDSRLFLLVFFVIVEATCAFVYIVINNNKESKQNQQKINKNNLESCDVCSTLSIWLCFNIPSDNL